MTLEIPIIDEEQYLNGVLWYRVELSDIKTTLGNNITTVDWSIVKGAGIEIMQTDLTPDFAAVKVKANAAGVNLVRGLININDDQKQPIYLRITVINPA